MASNKPTAVHFSLIFFVMLSIIMTVAFYLNYRDYNAREAAITKAEEELKAVQNQARQQDDAIQALKERLGHAYDDVGVNSPDNPNTVLGAMAADIRNFGGNVAQGTYSATIRQLRAELDNMIRERDLLKADRDDLQARYLALQQIHNEKVKQHDDARIAAETDLKTRVGTHEEQIVAKDSQISELQARASQLQIELQQESEAHLRDNKENTEKLTNLMRVNAAIQEKLDNVTKVSFEQEDATIVRVDHLSGLVWINVGSADKLHKRTTFSVYTKGHAGVARGGEDIKGAIEVTNITGSHLAEARIIEEDIHRPIAPGDPIYTPLWSPGHEEHFAFVGAVDLDDDGQQDRDLLREIVHNAGAKITSEVLDTGERLGDELDVNTKFLVVGEIPIAHPNDPPEEVDRVNAIQEHRKNLIDEARIQGVRVVNLQDFLSYMGYRPRRRLFIPGMVDRPYNLKAGAASTTVDEVLGNRESSGRVSKLYGTSRLKEQDVSAGQTSKLFGGN